MLLLAERLTDFPKKLGPLAHVYAMIAVILGWTMFRAETLAKGIEYIGMMLGYTPAGFIDNAFFYYWANGYVILLTAILFSLPVLPWLQKRPLWQILEPFAAVGVFVISLLMTINATYSPFISIFERDGHGKNKKSRHARMRVFLCLMMTVIFVRYFTVKICRQTHTDNAYVRAILSDNRELRTLAGLQDTANVEAKTVLKPHAVDWAALFPFEDAEEQKNLSNEKSFLEKKLEKIRGIIRMCG